MPSTAEQHRLSLSLSPGVESPRLARVFVSTVLETVGLDSELIDDVAIVVSDLVTALTLATVGALLEIELEPGRVSMSGNWVPGGRPPVPLLGDALSLEGQHWQICLGPR